jgi:hypothetical protein
VSAAAHDLLVALQNLLMVYEQMARSGSFGPAWDPSQDPEVVAARAAIAKARHR